MQHQPNSPCAGPLWQTTDGGFTWNRTATDAYQLDLVAPGDLWVLSGSPGGSAPTAHQVQGGGANPKAVSLTP